MLNKKYQNKCVQFLTWDKNVEWNPDGTFDGKLMTATGLDAIVLASIITTSEFLEDTKHFSNNNIHEKTL